MGKDLYRGNIEVLDDAVHRSIAAVTTIVALIYCHQHDRDLSLPDPNASLAENLLIMIGRVQGDSGKPDPIMTSFLNRTWILYADHEMTASTSAGLHCASTLADPASAMIATVCAAGGPLHGGAIDIAYKNFERTATKENVQRLIDDVKAKKYRLFGYGHRIYKTVDPRLKYLRAMLEQLTAHDDEMSPLLAVALEIDRVASTDSYFTSRNLKPNADLYGSFVFAAMYVLLFSPFLLLFFFLPLGRPNRRFSLTDWLYFLLSRGFDPRIISSLMVNARAVGFLAHWRELIMGPARLWRPLQVFTGKLVA